MRHALQTSRNNPHNFRRSALAPFEREECLPQKNQQTHYLDYYEARRDHGHYKPSQDFED